ncbi:acyl-CoA dehydrogenase family protein [Streptosporangium soli]|nr:hypothetical protein [Streptosporangium sp. KLBMP 9127]
MRFLERERATLAKLLPGLDEGLRAVPLMELEGPDSPGIQLFRDKGGPGLLVPSAQEGRGGTALDALRVQRALGSRAPSLAVATTTHHYSIATLISLLLSRNRVGDVYELAADNQLVTASFAEPFDAGILSSLTATDGDVMLINGVTRPYSLARSMDRLLAKVTVSDEEHDDEGQALTLMPADAEGVTVSGAGAEGELVTFHDVNRRDGLLVPLSAKGQANQKLTAGFAWFQVLMTGSYLGAASALVERALLNDQVPESERVRLLVETELAMSTAEGVAGRIDAGDPDESTLAAALYVRYSVQDTLARIVPRAVDLLGDLDPTASDEVAYLTTFANGLTPHPPTQSQMAGPLEAHLAGGPLTLA